MEYSPLFLLIIVLPLVLFWSHLRRIKRRVLLKIIERSLLKTRPKNAWYSSTAIQGAAQKLSKLPRTKLQPVLTALRQENFAPLLKVSSAPDLKIITGKAKVGDKFQQAESALINLDYARCRKLVDCLEAKSKTEQARLFYLQAALALNEGDLLTASTQAAAAIKLFQKLDFIYEEAQTYLLSGTIYRACAVEDSADFMLRTAQMLFGFINATAKEAETLANLGMLMVMQSRFDEADDYFAKAQKLYQSCPDEEGENEIINQQSLSALINKDFKTANTLARRARKAFQGMKNIRGEALSLDILAQTAAATADWQKVIAPAKAAEELYQQQSNLSGALEMAFLQAQALLEAGKEALAEKNLRQIIEAAGQSQTCFHIANAYNLLGIIYLRQGDLRRAEGLFQQSLSAELQNERWCGAAIDYANIALTAYRRGHKEHGDKNRALALQYAKDAGAENLVQMLEAISIKP